MKLINLKNHIKIRVNTMDKNCKGTRAGKQIFHGLHDFGEIDLVCNLWDLYDCAIIYDIKFRINLFDITEPSLYVLF